MALKSLSQVRSRTVLVPLIVAPVALVLTALLAMGLFRREPQVVTPDMHFREALFNLQRGDHVSVFAAIEVLNEHPRFAPHVHLLQGGMLLRHREYQSALDELALTRPVGELREPALIMTGQCLYHIGQLADAESLFRRLASEQPDHPEAHRWLAAIYYDLGAMDQARVHLTALAKLLPDDYTPHFLSGQVYLDFEEYAKSADAYQQALDRNPPAEAEQEIRVNLARALVKLRDYQPALEALADVNPSPAALALRAESYSNLGEANRAQELLKQALALAPDNRDVLLLQARLLGDAGKPEQAVKCLTALLESAPHDYEGRYQLSLAYRQLGRTEDYEREAAQLEADRALYNRLTDLSKEAIRVPHDAAVRDELASVCRQLEKHELAQMWHAAAEACRRAAAVK